MRIVWSISSLPELESYPKQQRQKVFRRAYWKSFRHWQTWIAVLICAACVAVGLMIGGPGPVIGGFIGGILFAQVSVNMARPYVPANSGS